MLLSFYKLREQPFGVTPNPRYFCATASHREALAALRYSIDSGVGFATLIAAPGMGKTTLLFDLLEKYSGSCRSAFIFHTQDTSPCLLRLLLHDLQVSTDGDDPVAMLDALHNLLVREAKAKRRVLVFIDEAQNLTDQALETVRLLSNFETTETKLLHVILAGQSQLGTRLCQSSLAQLAQRITINARLKPLSRTDVGNYVNHRLRVAGYAASVPLFAPDALGAIAEDSEGIPRNINRICFNALSLGFAMHVKMIDQRLIREVVDDLSFLRNRGMDTEPEILQKAANAVPARVQPALGAPGPQRSMQVGNRTQPSPVAPFTMNAAPLHSPVSFPSSSFAANSSARPVGVGLADFGITEIRTCTPEPDVPYGGRNKFASPAGLRQKNRNPISGDPSRRPTPTANIMLPLGIVACVLLMSGTTVWWLHDSIARVTTIASPLPAPVLSPASGNAAASSKVRVNTRPSQPAAAGIDFGDPSPRVSRATNIPPTRTATIESGKNRKAIPAPIMSGESGVKRASIGSTAQSLLSQNSLGGAPLPSFKRSSTSETSVKHFPIAPRSESLSSTLAEPSAENKLSQSYATNESTRTTLGAASGSAAAPHPIRAAADAPSAALAPVTPLRLQNSPSPRFPELAKRLGISGTVVLRVLVGNNGSVRAAEVVSGSPILAQAAVDAVREWRYIPASVNGKPIEAETRIVVRFSLRESP